MKKFKPLLFILSTAITHSQTKFTFTENGLTPEFTVFKVDSSSASKLYPKTLQWIRAKHKNPERTIVSQIERKEVQISSIKENAIQAGKRYFHIKYTIKISFQNGQYTFEPLSVQTKANSKYDMGWKEVDLKNGATFFKKGKVIKQTKSYVEVVPELLNKLNGSLYNHLISD